MQEPIPVLNTDEMASLRNWAKGGPEALATPTTRTGANPVTFSTPGSVSQEQQHRAEEQTKRGADEEESESSNSEEEGESPITLSSDKEEYEGSDTPSDPGRPETPPYQVNRRLPGRRPRRSPRGQNGRQHNRRSRAVVVVRPTKGGKGRSAYVGVRSRIFARSKT